MTLTGMAQDSFMLDIACGLKIGSVSAQDSNCGHRPLDSMYFALTPKLGTVIPRDSL